MRFGKLALPALLTAALLFTSGLSSCGKPQTDIPPGDTGGLQVTLEQALAMCGPDCHVVGFYVDVYDADMQPIAGHEQYPIELTINAQSLPPGATQPVPAEVWNADKTAMVPSPYTDPDAKVPYLDVQVVDPYIVQIAIEVVVTLPAGWTAKCRGTDGAAGATVSEHSVTNEDTVDDEDILGGLPREFELFCSWPVDLPDLPGLFD